VKVLVLLNDAAGTLASSASGDEAQRISAAFAGQGVRAEVRAVPGPQLCEAARRAIGQGFDAIVAGGGDGTLNAVSSALAGTGQAFAALPLGTMNHLARELGMPLDLEQAVAAIARGRAVDLPVGEVNGRIFLSFSGIGLYADIIRHRDAQRSARGRGKWPAMLIAFLRMLRRFPLFRVGLRIGPERLKRLTPLVFIALSDYQMRLFGAADYACERRRALSLFIARRVSRSGMLALLLRSMLRRLRLAEDLEAMCLDAFTLELRRPHVRVAIDGEVVDLPTPLEYRLCPRPLKIILP
jgi:diacylglycerol kinase family enzyme